MRPHQNFNTKRHKYKNQPKRNTLPQKNKAFDSTGPFGVKVRGTAQQVFDKYTSLSRDAYTAGERVDSESYSQYAEHYFRELERINILHEEIQKQQAEAAAKAAAQKQAEINSKPSETPQASEATPETSKKNMSSEKKAETSKKSTPKNTVKKNEAKPTSDISEPPVEKA